MNKNFMANAKIGLATAGAVGATRGVLGSLFSADDKVKLGLCLAVAGGSAHFASSGKHSPMMKAALLGVTISGVLEAVKSGARLLELDKKFSEDGTVNNFVRNSIGLNADYSGLYADQSGLGYSKRLGNDEVYVDENGQVVSGLNAIVQGADGNYYEIEDEAPQASLNADVEDELHGLGADEGLKGDVEDELHGLGADEGLNGDVEDFLYN